MVSAFQFCAIEFGRSNFFGRLDVLQSFQIVIWPYRSEYLLGPIFGRCNSQLIFTTISFQAFPPLA